VVIGRNEGDRLVRCLDSIVPRIRQVVYVDSGSTDASVANARARQVDTVELDMSIPFTAARSRNAGFKRLRELAPSLRFVQFIDGDCELLDGWLATAAEFLETNARVAAVAGRLREKYRERSIYNTLCDIEWERPAGEIRECGGISMIRVSAFDAVQGFRNDLIAGEEPELCVRLRQAGWRIWSLSEDMATHDAAILTFGQWWKRTQRAGYAYAQGASLHGAPPERYGIRESGSAWFWGFCFPAITLALGVYWTVWALFIFAIYPLQIARLAMTGRYSSSENWLRAVFLILGKFPETLGQGKFWLNRYMGRQPRLIEYK